jgi:serine phosphatase RsbU (regulator of sigma subunit)
MKKPAYTIRLIFLFLFICEFSFAQEVIEISDNFQKLRVGKKHLRIFKDETSQMTLKELLQVSNDKFAPPKDDSPNYGYTKSVIFAKFSLRNQDTKQQEVLLEIDYPVLDDVRFYLLDEASNIVKEYKTGDWLPFGQRELPTRNFVFSLPLEPYKTYTVVLRIKNDSTVSFPITLWQPDNFWKAENYSMWWFGIFYGIMLVMLLYNLFIYSVLKEPSYLWYVLNIIAIVLFQLAFNGIGFQYLWGNIPGFNHFNMPLAASLLTLFSIGFSRLFLNTAVKQQVLDKIFIVLIAIAIITAFLSFFITQRISLRFATFMVLPSSIAILYGGFNALRQGYRPARFFVVSWLVYLIGALLVALRGLGLTPTNFITTYSIQIGSAIEVILLSLALADRINTLRKEIAQRALEKERLEKEKEREMREVMEQQNERLEQLVTERTHELFDKNKQLTDSIQYAQRIQKAILPSKDTLIRYFPECFIYFKPRDIVSGDFYWFGEKDNKIVIAVVDCTGHGVPGAFMSMIGNTLLNQIVLERGVTRPAEILNQLHQEVRTLLKQNDEDGSKDGMDMSICVYHQLHHIIEFAGANNPMYLIKNGELIEYKADRMGIGGTHKNENEHFTNHIIKLGSEDVSIYLFTDGYADQFGEKTGSKFMARNLKKMLLELSHLKSMKAQHLEINKTMEEWRGKEKQLDDQLMIGFRISASASRTHAEISSKKDVLQRKVEQPFKFTR